MGFWDRFLFDTTRSDDPTNSHTAGDTGKQGKVADFLTSQSMSWSVAILIVGTLWAFAQQQAKGNAQWEPLANSPLVPFVVAAAIVLGGFFASWVSLGSWSGRLGAFIFGAINAALLTAAFYVDKVILPK